MITTDGGYCTVQFLLPYETPAGLRFSRMIFCPYDDYGLEVQNFRNPRLDQQVGLATIQDY